MCGICGVVYANNEKPVDQRMVRRMTDIIGHRGPDSQGLHINSGIGLGVRRLSIIDLDSGDQPISNENGTLTVICNGEIYNYIELRKELLAKGHRFSTSSDVEVIVHLYEEHGAECVRHLRGMFTFALWDAVRNQLMLARDRLGIKPLNYAISHDALYFGSEIKSVLISDHIERQIDVHSLNDIFSFGFVIAPKTLFKRIRRLLPGHYLLYRAGNVSINCYWDIDFTKREEAIHSKSEEEWSELLVEGLKESVRLHLRSDVQVGAWLSSGIDSSAIVSLMGQNNLGRISTFSLSFEDPDFDEVSKNRTLDRYHNYNLDNQRAVFKNKDFELLPDALWYYEEPTTSCLEIARIMLSRLSSENVKVVLTGEGADEIFGGYGWFQLDKLLRPFARLPISLRRLMLSGPRIPGWWPRASNVFLAPKEMGIVRYRNLIGLQHNKLQEKLFSPEIKSMLLKTEGPECWPKPPDQFQNWHPFSQLQYYEMKVRLPDFVIHHLDHGSMACSLEARVPFLDHKFVELCAQIPTSLMSRKRQEKYILRRAMSGFLPQEIIQRKKRGLMAPFSRFLAEDLPDFAEDLLSKKNLEERGYFNPDFVAHMLKTHRTGKGNYGRYLMGVLEIQLWDQLFRHGCCPDPDSGG